MPILFWKKNKQIDTFANSIANELYSTIQPDAALEFVNELGSKKTKTGVKVARKLDDIILRINQFRTENPLGVYGKARLYMKFAQQLEELGYEKKVVKVLNEKIMIRTP
jgi:hypothetical protein